MDNDFNSSTLEYTGSSCFITMDAQQQLQREENKLLMFGVFCIFCNLIWYFLLRVTYLY